MFVEAARPGRMLTLAGAALAVCVVSVLADAGAPAASKASVCADGSGVVVKTVYTGKRAGELPVKFGFYEAAVYWKGLFLFSDQWDECGQEWPAPLCDRGIGATGMLGYDTAAEKPEVYEVVVDETSSDAKSGQAQNYCGAKVDPVSGGLVLADLAGRNVVRIDRGPGGALETTVLASRYDGKRFTGPNDLAIRSDGIIYFSDSFFDADAEVYGAREIFVDGLYSIRTDGTVVQESADEKRPCNGVGLSPDGTALYCNVLPLHALDVFDVAPDGALSNRRQLLQSKRLSMPDGMTVRRSDGLIFVCGFMGSIMVVDPRAGEIVEEILVDAKAHVINAAFNDDETKLLVSGLNAVYELSMCGGGSK